MSFYLLTAALATGTNAYVAFSKDRPGRSLQRELSEMRPLFALRNVLIIIGAYYLSAWVAMPLWWPIAWFNNGRVYQPGVAWALSKAVNEIPIMISVVLAGAAAGYFLVGSRRRLWLAVVGGFIAICVWSSARWYVRPPLSDLLWQGAKALVAGLLAASACWFVQRWRRRLEAGRRQQASSS